MSLQPNTVQEQTLLTDLAVTLADLPAAYTEARTAAIATQLSADPKPLTCRYCGKHWSYWAGGKHDGHVVCVVTLEFQRALCKMYRSDPCLSMQTVADACGVTLSVVIAWIRNTDRQRARLSQKPEVTP